MKQLFGFLLFAQLVQAQKTKLIDFVNPFIGTDAHGHTYPGASMPFGMVQLSPDTRLTGWDGCSGYHFSDKIVYGFSHTHLSGTGVGDYGDILLMPMTGRIRWEKGDETDTKSGYCSAFDKKAEVAKAGYYKTHLLDDNIGAELTATTRVGIHQYTFPNNDTARILVDLIHRDEVLNAQIQIIDNQTIAGFRNSKAWATDQRLFFYIQFSKPFISVTESTDVNKFYQVHKHKFENIPPNEGKKVQAAFTFPVKAQEKIMVKVGISAVSIEGAKKNLLTEAPHWKFEDYHKTIEKAWEQELSKIQVQTDNLLQKVIFYTALYHSFLNPNTYQDVDGNYLGRDLKVHQAQGFTNYSVFSLWDTYRATHPLFTLVQQQKTTDFINTFLAQYEQGGLLPVWELSANETGCMIGYHAVPVIVDAYLKGIRGFDAEKAYQACRKSAMEDRLGLSYLKKNNFIASDEESESVSKTLEYAYDDWCIAQFAKALGKTNDYQYFIQRAQAYKNLLDNETGCMRPKQNQRWKTPFEPREVDFNFTEANSWQYSFYVPQDIQGLIAQLGGNEPFTKKLDELFTADSKTIGREQVDITGLIGQYAHGNEPSHHIAYLYAYAGKAWKTQELTRKICTELYTEKPDGLCGNEDCGQMSAWYVLSALGFYSVTPASTDYILGSPMFDQASLKLENGKTFTIKTINNSANNKYIKQIRWNKQLYNKMFITQEMILQGGTLELEMSNEPNKELGASPETMPKTQITEFLIVPVPFLETTTNIFADSLKINLLHTIKSTNTTLFNPQIYYSTNDSEFQLFQKPFHIHETTTIRFYTQTSAGKSNIVQSHFKKYKTNCKIQLLSKYNAQYTAGGEMGLVDGAYGQTDFRLGGWQGYQYQDFECIIDLGKEQSISELSANFLQEVRSWIWFPTKVEFSLSKDGKTYSNLGTVINEVSPQDYTPQIKKFTIEKKNSSARYIKVKAYTFGTIPDWHAGAGDGAFIFIDEVEIK